MNDALATAIVGALATVISSALGAFAVIKKAPATEPVSTDPVIASQAAAASAHAQKGKRKAALTIGFIGLALGALVVFLGFQFGSSEEKRHTKAINDTRVATLSKAYSGLLEKGLDKPYVLPSLVMLTTIEKTPDGKQVVEDQRTIYFTHAMKNISSTDNAQAQLFPEEYDSRHPVDRVPGSESELVNNADFPNKWQVRFDAKEGQFKSLVTGVHHIRPFAEQVTKGLCAFPELRKTEECFCYPNDQNDVIGEVLMIVQSKSLNLNSGGAAAAVISRANRANEPVDVVARTLGDGTSVPSTIVARFSDVQKGDTAAVKVRWGDQ